jgi:hypothetical protein
MHLCSDVGLLLLLLQRCKHFEIGGDKKSKGAAY